jgi:large subunit ribosomal protein L18
VFRSETGIYAQIIDDEAGRTICQASTRSKDLKGQIPAGCNKASAKAVGSALAERAKSQGVDKVCFDRNGFRYHGRIKSLADAVREGGISF